MRERRFYRSCAVLTQFWKLLAASEALHHLKASLSGLHCAPGEIPSEWISCSRRNIERSVNSSSLLTLSS